MINAHIDAVPTEDVVLNTHFRIEPCSSCPIGGYLIVSPRVPVSSLGELSPDAQNALGATLAAATRAIESVVHPRRVYCALFAEATGSVHFHLFPRTDWLLSSYSRAHPEDTVVSGPRLLDWARSTFREPLTDDCQRTTDAIFHPFTKSSMRWSERRTAARSTFEMISTLPLRSARGLVRRRSSCSR